MGRPALAASALLAAFALSAPAAASAATPVVHAHRGGALADGKPIQPEDTLPAFRSAASVAGTWLEMDAVVSSDGVPFVLHDSTLDRTTNCSGAVIDKTAAEVDACQVDVLGVSATLQPLDLAAPPVRVSRLADVLAFAKQAGKPVNLEIKRIPGDPGYVPGDETYATAVMDVVRAAALPPENLIIQSFDPTNLDTAERELPGVATSFLTLAGLDAGGLALAAARGYEWISPSGVPSAGMVSAAHGAGLKIVPYTLDTEADVRAAAAAGVDALITDDLPVAHRALGLPAPFPPPDEASQNTAPVTPRLDVRSSSRRGVLRHRGVAVVLRATAPIRATVRVTSGKLTVARGTVRLTKAGQKRVRLPLTRAGRRLLQRRKSVRLTVRAVVGRAKVTYRLTLA